MSVAHAHLALLFSQSIFILFLQQELDKIALIHKTFSVKHVVCLYTLFACGVSV